jgi:Zn-finger nucleic acid-binding protein
MARCPVCQSVRIVLVLSPTRLSFCTDCGTRWLQDGSEQRRVQRSEDPPVAAAPPA